MSEGYYCRVDGTYLSVEDVYGVKGAPEDDKKVCMLNRKMLRKLRIDIYREYKKGKMSLVSWRELRDLIVAGRFAYIIVAGKIVACVALRDYGQFNELGLLFVHPDYRGQGFAMTMASEMLKRAMAMDKPVVVTANMYSTGIFRKLGFAERPKSDMPTELVKGCKACPQFGKYPSCHCSFMVYEAD